MPDLLWYPVHAPNLSMVWLWTFISQLFPIVSIWLTWKRKQKLYHLPSKCQHHNYKIDKLMCWGLLLILGGCGLLFWNEGRAVKTAVSLDGKTSALLENKSSDGSVPIRNYKKTKYVQYHMTYFLKSMFLESAIRPLSRKKKKMIGGRLIGLTWFPIKLNCFSIQLTCFPIQVTGFSF